MTGRICTVDGCTRPWRTRRMCAAHYEQHRTRQKAYGRWGHGSFVDAQPVRDHILALADAGISWKRLHKLSGVPLSSISRIIHGRGGRQRGHEGPAKHVTSSTADRILAVPVPTVWWTCAADGRCGDQSGTTRRLQALVAIGHTQSALARRLDVVETNATALFFGRRQVTAGRARQVAALYDQLSMTPGESERARRRAERLGWLPPLAWDDDTLDDPTAVPALDPDSLADRRLLSKWWRRQPCRETACDRLRAGVGVLLCHKHKSLAVGPRQRVRVNGPRKLTEDDKAAILARSRQGVTAARLADEFGVSERTIQRYRAQVAS